MDVTSAYSAHAPSTVSSCSQSSVYDPSVAQYYYNCMRYWQERYYALLASTSQPGPPQFCDQGAHVPGGYSSSTESKPMSTKRVRKKQKQHRKLAKTGSPRTFGGDLIFDVDSRLLQGSQEDEVLECHMEITDEMVDFFAQSARHRQERGEQRLLVQYLNSCVRS